MIQSAEVSPKNNGDMVVVTNSGSDDVRDARGTCGRKEKNVEGFKWVVRGDFFEALEARAHRKSCDINFVFGEITCDQPFASMIVSDEKIVAGGASPGGINFDGVGYDSNNGDAAPCRKLSVNHIRV